LGPSSAVTTSAAENAANTAGGATARSAAMAGASTAGRYTLEAQDSVWVLPSSSTNVRLFALFPPCAMACPLRCSA
jgi:hypothetical protein